MKYYDFKKCYYSYIEVVNYWNNNLHCALDIGYMKPPVSTKSVDLLKNLLLHKGWFRQV